MLVSTSTSECRASFFPLHKNNFNGYSNICFVRYMMSQATSGFVIKFLFSV